MIRRIVLTDVTAMAGDAVCIAGIDISTDETLRLSRPQPTNQMLKQFGGLAPGDIIDIDVQRLANPLAPHVEDCHWIPRSLKKIEIMSADKLREFLQRSAFDSLEEALGAPAVRTGGRNRGWPPGMGARSLASVSIRYVRYIVDHRSTLRATFRDVHGAYWEGVPFQDLSVRTHRPGCEDCQAGSLAHVRSDFEANRTLIRVGLTRPFAPQQDQPPLCWLQVTNVLARERQHF